MAGSSAIPMKWDASAPGWRSFLEEAEMTPEGKKTEFMKSASEGLHKGAFKNLTEEDYEGMKDYRTHAAHVMMWCPAKDTDVIIEFKIPLQYRIMMQMRFDGKLGFPGGEIDEIKEFTFTPDNYQDYMKVIKQGLIREVQEEMELELKSDPKHILTSVPIQKNAGGGVEKKYILHFFSVQISLEEMELMENSFGKILSNDEVLGLTRVPLYLIWMKGTIRGLPCFINNVFAGNSSDQLLDACVVEGLLTLEQVRVATRMAECVRNGSATEVYTNHINSNTELSF